MEVRKAVQQGHTCPQSGKLHIGARHHMMVHRMRANSPRGEEAKEFVALGTVGPHTHSRALSNPFFLAKDCP